MVTKIVVFGDDRRVGLLRKDTVIDVNAAVRRYFADKKATGDADRQAPADLLAFISAGDAAIDLAGKAADHAEQVGDGSVLKSSTVRLRAPFPGRRVFCAGGNYGQHASDALTKHFKPITRELYEKESREHDPWGFTKILLSATGPDDTVTYPKRTEFLDYEIELAIVLGRGGKDISVKDAESYIWGMTLANDWSIRDDSPAYINAVNFNLQKNFDGSLCLGPCIRLGRENLLNTQLVLKVNGEIRQNYNTKNMIFTPAELIAFLSKDFPLAPGDVIMLGTDDGTAMDLSPKGPDGKPVRDLFLKPGDVVELSSPEIGAMQNRVVAG